MSEVEELQLIPLFHLAKIGLWIEHSNPGLEKKMRCNKEEAAEGTKMKQATLIIVGNFFIFHDAPHLVHSSGLVNYPHWFRYVGAKSRVMPVFYEGKK